MPSFTVGVRELVEAAWAGLLSWNLLRSGVLGG